MLLVILHLDGAAALRLIDGQRHGIRHLVGVHDHLPRHVSSRAADGLDERTVVAQETFLVGIQDSDERYLRQVQALAQKVDAHQHVELAAAQIAQDLDALERGDVGVHVARLHSLVQQVVRQVLGHLLRQRGDEHALIARSALLRLVDDVVDLRCRAAHDDLGIQQAGGADDLLHLLLRHLLLVVARRGRHVHELRDAILELVEAQRTVVQAAGQTEAVLGQCDLARAIALVHAADLRNRHVALVDDAEEVFREIVDQRVGRLSRLASVHVARVILDARAEVHRLQHLEVVVHAHLEALRLQQLAFLLELLQALAQFVADGAQRAIHLRTRGHVVGGRPDRQSLELAQHFARHVVDLGDGLDLVAPELDADRMVGVRREHIERIAAHAERAALLLVVVAVVLDIDELMDDLVAIHVLLLVHEHGHAGVVHRAANAVDARHRRHHDAVAPRQQSRRGRMAQLLHLFVDGRVLLDERVRRGHVRLGLVVIVVRHEVHHGVVGKELLQLAGQLRRQRLVRSHDQRGLLHGLDDLCHGERLAGTGDAQQVLIAQALLDAGRQLLDGLRLIARRLVRRHRFERRGGKTNLGQLALHLDAFDIGKMSHAAPSEQQRSTDASEPRNVKLRRRSSVSQHL